MNGQAQPATRIEATPPEVASAFIQACLKAGLQPSTQLIATLLAQSALETGHWRIMYNFNFGNVKATDTWVVGGGDFTFFDYAAPHAKAPVSENLNALQRDHALRSAGVRIDGSGEPDMIVGGLRTDGRWTCWFWPPHIQTRFRAFASLAEGASAYLGKLLNRYKSALSPARLGDVEGYVAQLHSKGYFTADLTGYTRSVKSLYRTYLPIAETAMNDTPPDSFSTLPDSGAFTSDAIDMRVHTSGFHTLASGARVSKLPVWDQRHGGPAHVGHGPASQWLHDNALRLPTTAEMEELHAAAVFIPPHTMPTVDLLEKHNIPHTTAAINKFRVQHMMSQRWAKLHDAAVLQKLKRVGHTDEPVSNFGKHWVLPTGTIFGWWTSPGTKKIQNPSKAHANESTYVDYATNFHAVMPAGAHQADTTAVTSFDYPVLQLGGAGPDVRAIQARLGALGFSLMSSGGVDGKFGTGTQRQVKALQAAAGLPQTGVVDMATWLHTEGGVIQLPEVVIIAQVPDTLNLQDAEGRLVAPTGADRQRIFGPLEFVQTPRKGNVEAIRITNTFEADHIVRIEVPQLALIRGVNGQGKGPKHNRIAIHRLAVHPMLRLWDAWEKAGLLPLVLTWAGMWAPRTKRGRADLSNHAFATAFDVNAPWNGLDRHPANPGSMGSVRELVPLANMYGWAWGGDYQGRKDGMHFELAKV